MLDVLDDTNAGLIAGYSFLPETKGQRLNWADAQKATFPEGGRFRWLPFASGWTRFRDFPVPHGRTFQAQWRQRRTKP